MQTRPKHGATLAGPRFQRAPAFSSCQGSAWAHAPSPPPALVRTRACTHAQVYSMFVDVKRSTQFLIEYQEQYMYNEVPEADAVPVEEMETSV
jgi:hypothetical protein